jgi:hypothetical protein
MKQVLEQPWAQTNGRLVNYIQEELYQPKEKPSRLADKYRLNTASRLGFEPNAHYSQADIMRTNPICTGEYQEFLKV